MSRFAMSAATRRVVAFGAVMFSSSLMNNVFVTYYLELFLHSGITPAWFYGGQTVFMLWNAVNDPLFGWLSDNYLPSLASTRGRRTTAIKYGGALWALAFLLVWFPPSHDHPVALGLHFMLCLCFYDGMLSYVEVNHNALLAEMTVSEQERAKALSVSAVFAGIGSFSSYAGGALWDRTSMFPFQCLCVVLAAAAFVVFELCASALHDVDRFRELQGSSVVPLSDADKAPAVNAAKLEAGDGASAAQATSENDKGSATTFVAFVFQLMGRRNFVVFLLLAFVQQFDCTYEKTFMSYTINHVAGSEVSIHARSTIISLSFMMPHIMTVMSFPILKKYGVHAAVTMILGIRLALVALGWTLGHASAWVMCLFILCNRVVSEALCRLFPMISSDLVDEDMYLARRKRSLSASLIAVVYFFSKFSQSLAPMLGYGWLPSTGGPPKPHDTDGVSDGSGSFVPAGEATPADPLVWNLLLGVVTVCVALQLAMWSLYTLKGPHLKRVKRMAAQLPDEGTAQDAEAPSKYDQ